MEEHAMATLNIKNFPDSLYAQLQERAEREHRSLAQQVVHLLEESSGKPKLHSILELRPQPRPPTERPSGRRTAAHSAARNAEPAEDPPAAMSSVAPTRVAST